MTRLVFELQQRCLLLEVPHPVRVTVLKIGLNDVENCGVVSLQIFRYFAYGSTMNFVFVQNVDAWFVRDEFLREPLILPPGRRHGTECVCEVLDIL